jgi:hypothetical protein
MYARRLAPPARPSTLYSTFTSVSEPRSTPSSVTSTEKPNGSAPAPGEAQAGQPGEIAGAGGLRAGDVELRGHDLALRLVHQARLELGLDGEHVGVLGGLDHVGAVELDGHVDVVEHLLLRREHAERAPSSSFAKAWPSASAMTCTTTS